MRDQLAEFLDSIQMNEIRLSYEKMEDTPAGAQSRIGGCPDLPEGFAWPFFRDETVHPAVTKESIQASKERTLRSMENSRKAFLEMIAKQFKGAALEKRLKEAEADLDKFQKASLQYYDNMELREAYTTVRDLPLTFLGQINCAEAALFDKDHLLPETGLLSFFYEMESMWGDNEGKFAGNTRVYYFEDVKALKRTAPPDTLQEKENQIGDMRITFTAHKSIPSFADSDIWEKALDGKGDQNGENEWNLYLDAARKLGCVRDDGCDPPEEVIKLLGFPDTIQNSMYAQLSAGWNRSFGKKEGMKGWPDPAEDWKDWILLFQLGTVEDSESGGEWMFGDDGYLYFWIRRQDLAEKRFDRIMMICQCY